MAQLNEQVQAALRQPIPTSALKTREGRGGKTFTYADVDYLEGRLSEVDADWQNDSQVEIAANGAGFGVTVRTALKILGVQRVANAGYFIPVIVRYWDKESKQWKERQLTGDEFHTNIGRIEASGFRRACARFTLGAELWADEPLTHEEAPADAPAKQPTRAASNGKIKGPTQAQLNLLTSTLGLPQSVIDGLDFTAAPAAWYPSGKPSSSMGSELIGLMLKIKDQDQSGYTAKAAYTQASQQLKTAQERGHGAADADADADTW